jgi:hypothetical protein
MSKIGDSLDNKISQINIDIKDDEKKNKKLKPLLKYESFYIRFTGKLYLFIYTESNFFLFILELQSESNTEVSIRIKFLIKNMFDYRQGGWKKMKKDGEDGPKKVQDLRKEMEDSLRKDDRDKKRDEDEYYGH